MDPNLQEDTTTRPSYSTSRRTAKPQVTTSKTIIRPATTNLPSSKVRDQPESIDPNTNRPFDPNYNLQGIGIDRPTTEKPILPEYVDNNGIYVVPPTIYSPGGEGEGGGFNARPDIEDPDVYLRPVDPRLRGFGEPSVNIVEARVEELANTTRGSTIGVATISSITVGIIALLGFGLIIFMALARRRRKYDATAASSANLTPTQSRTTFSGTPVMADTPSVSGGAWDDPLNTTGSSSIDPVVAIDGHQTIISSYNEFMSIPNDARNNIMHSLPSPQSSLEGGQHAPLSTSTPPLPGGPQNPGNNNASSSGHGPHTGQGGIPRTRDLIKPHHSFLLLILQEAIIYCIIILRKKTTQNCDHTPLYRFIHTVFFLLLSFITTFMLQKTTILLSNLCRITFVYEYLVKIKAKIIFVS